MMQAAKTGATVELDEAQYCQLLERSADAVLIQWRNHCVFANGAAARLFGAPSAEKILGRDIVAMTHPDFREFVKQRIELAYGGKHEKFQKIKIHRLVGHPVDIEIMALAINYQGLPALQVVLRDLTSGRAAAETCCEDKNPSRPAPARLEVLPSLVEGLAHDLNNVLMSILGNITLAAASDADELPHSLAVAEQGCYQAHTLVRQLQMLAQGKTPPKKPLDIVKILKEAARQAVTRSNTGVEFELAEPLWQVEANLGQMYQVFGNLFLNAAQAMPTGGVVRVQAKNLEAAEISHGSLPPGRYVALTVADQGVGIASEYLPKVFDPAFTTKPQGKGLGLATVLAIVKNHQGHILVESELGRGTTFHLFLRTSD